MKHDQNYQGGAIKLKVIAVLVVVVVASLVAVVLLRVTKLQPYQVAGNSFIDGLAADNTTSTYNMLTTSLKQQVGSKQSWGQSVDASFKNSSAKTKLVSSAAVPNPVATYGKTADPWRLTYQLSFSNGKTYNMYIIVLKDKSSWKVDEYNTLFAK